MASVKYFFRQFLCTSNSLPALRTSVVSKIEYFHLTICFGGYPMSVFRNLPFVFNGQVIYRCTTIYVSSALFVQTLEVYWTIV